MRRLALVAAAAVSIVLPLFAATEEPPVPPVAPAAPVQPLTLPPAEAATAARIVAAARDGHRAWTRLADLCDRVGPRSAGTPGYAHAIDWALAEMKKDALDNVRRENVTVKTWKRGAESLVLESPGGPRELPLTTLGRSVGTPPEGITAPVFVVKDFAELDRAGDKARGKIVLFNFPMHGTDYGEAVAYRWGGANHAAKAGGVAALVRSVTTLAVRAPHTGTMGYEEGITKVPAAAITLEDADMLQRLQDAGVTPTVHLTLGAKEYPDTVEGNIVGEIRGRELPDETVLIGAHLDSWDLSCGAHDDGAGVAMVLEAMRLLKQLGVAPRRTVRAVLYDNEERGLEGGTAYLEAHRAELPKHVAAIEADSGGFRPTGFGCEAGPGAAERAATLAPLFSALGTITIKAGGSGADISTIVGEGVPGFGLSTDNLRYFDYHHSALDTADKVDPEALNDASAALAILAHALAETPDTLARKAPKP